MQLKFRKAEMADLEEIFQLVNSATVHMIKQNIFQWDELYPTKKDLLADIHRGQLSVATTEGRIVAIYVINQECDVEYRNGSWLHPDRPFVVIHRLCVRPDYQNRGIARRTLLKIEADLIAVGIHAIRLDVFTQNPFALKLYEGLGYVKTGYADWRKGRFWLMEKYF